MKPQKLPISLFEFRGKKTMKPFEKKASDERKMQWQQQQNTATAKNKMNKYDGEETNCVQYQKSGEKERDAAWGKEKGTQMEIPAYKRARMCQETGIDFFFVLLLVLIVGFIVDLKIDRVTFNWKIV